MDASPQVTRGETRQSEYLHNWDRLRVIGSLDIIGSHLNGAHTFGGVGLPAFLMVSLALTARSTRELDLGGFLRLRTQRILVPWLFWSLVIAVELSLRAAANSGDAFGWCKPEMLLYGPEIHLWFLPFVVAAGAVCASCASCANYRDRTARIAPRSLGWAAVLLGLGWLALCPYVGHGWPFEQWSFSMPAVCLGFGVGRLLGRGRRRVSVPAAALSFALGASLICTTLPLTAVYARRHTGALLFVAACTWLPNVPDPITRRLAPLMLGIYTLHLFVYRGVVGPLLRLLALDHSGTWRVLATFAITAGVVAALRRGPLSRVL